MKRNISILSLLILILGLTGCVYVPPTFQAEENAENPLDAAYDLSNNVYDLENGSRTTEDGEIVSVFGTPVKGELDGAGENDYAVILAHKLSGTGVFYFVGAAVEYKKTGALMGTRTVFLGDKIIVNSVTIEDGLIIVDYLTRADNEYDDVPPSVQKIRKFEVDDDWVGEVK